VFMLPPQATGNGNYRPCFYNAYFGTKLKC
jgi:hypothetical protein